MACADVRRVAALALALSACATTTRSVATEDRSQWTVKVTREVERTVTAEGAQQSQKVVRRTIRRTAPAPDGGVVTEEIAEELAEVNGAWSREAETSRSTEASDTKAATEATRTEKVVVTPWWRRWWWVGVLALVAATALLTRRFMK